MTRRQTGRTAVTFTGPSASVAQSYTAWLRASGASPQTVYLRSYYLRRLMRAHDGRDLLTLRPDELTAFLGDETWKPETRKAARSTVAGFYRWTADERLLGEDPARRVPPVRIPLGVPRPAPDTVLADAPCQSQHRDRLMLMFAAYADCRSLEVARVRFEDIVGDSPRMRGKGGREAVVPLHPVLLEAVHRRVREHFHVRGSG